MAERINLDAIERQVQRWVYPTVPVTDATGKPKLDANGSPVTRKSTAAEARKLATSRMLWVGFAELLTARDDNGNLVADIGQRTAALVADRCPRPLPRGRLMPTASVPSLTLLETTRPRPPTSRSPDPVRVPSLT